MIIDDPNDVLMHFGILRKSGRYPWGSGGNPEQRSRSFLRMQEELKEQGFSDVEICEALTIGSVGRDGKFHPSTTDLRAIRSLVKQEVKAADTAQAVALKEKGLSTSAIARRMDRNESSIRGLLKRALEEIQDIYAAISDMLKNEVDTRGPLDIGVGVEMHLGVTESRLKVAVARLKDQGYEVHSVQVPQLGTNQKTTVKVLAPPGTTYKDLAKDTSVIQSISKYSDDGGRSFFGLRPPENVSSKRIKVNYAKTGGADADGTIYLRRGVKDLSLGGTNYAQVRISVDGTHFIKGMAMYKDDLPKGIDIQFNTNKETTGNKLDALKPLKRLPKTDSKGVVLRDAEGKTIPGDEIDMDNPFGAVIKPNGQRGALNILNEEGDWNKWSKSISTQVLSKQPNAFAKTQLDLTFKQKKEEYDEIMALTNPVVKKSLLDKFAEDADASAVHLKAAALPSQRTQVILPINDMKDNEVYAPNFNNGDTVALIRYPHGGRFEIPELKVNNRQPVAKAILGNAKDAIGINSNVAARLSGADFDGDTVLVIPNNQGKIKTSPPLEGLKNFDPQSAYPGYPGMPKLDDAGKQAEMGRVSNLITDMTIRGAPHSDIVRAVKHSMVVIDAEKHNLNYKLSAQENGINQLKEKYQGIHDSGKLAGASTIISRAQSTVYPEKKRLRRASEGGPVDRKTGELVYVPTGEHYTITKTNRAGKTVTETVYKTQKSKALAEERDAFKLTSGGSEKNPGTPIEAIYATHSNRLKALANQARLSSINTPTVKRSPSAAKAYEPEVRALKAKLNEALKNAPLERKAQIVGNSFVKQKMQSNPEMTKEELKKVKGQALVEARIRVRAKKTRIEITPREWEAIQANAVSPNLLGNILKNAESDLVKALATPRTRTVMTDGKMARARAMLAAGHDQATIARALGVPLSTLHDAIQ